MKVLSLSSFDVIDSSEYTVNVQKLQTLFLFCSQIKMLVYRAGIHKMGVRIANSEDQKQTDLGLRYLSVPFWQATLEHLSERYLNPYR